MSKLTDIDSIYQDTISKLPKEERIAYCEKLIDKAQTTISKNKNFLSKTLHKNLTEIITAAQKELKILRNEIIPPLSVILFVLTHF